MRHLRLPEEEDVATTTEATDQKGFVTEAWKWCWMTGHRHVAIRLRRERGRRQAPGVTGTLRAWLTTGGTTRSKVA